MATRMHVKLAQVMEEGERLSKKQLAQENTIKKLRAELTEARSEKGSTSASLASERQKVSNASAHPRNDSLPGPYADQAACASHEVAADQVTSTVLSSRSGHGRWRRHRQPSRRLRSSWQR